ncbi:MAG: hypothetical protein QOG62_1391 [Thermoleophilaceae bacterium]|jgi:hypothetical protein|nr:hypothetical protein [Thermoleophilaceae bacterium]
MAMWAVMLGILMICLAFATGGASGAGQQAQSSAPVQQAPALTPHS